MSDEFYYAAIPEPTRILGLRLRPLSIGHLILLGRVRSAFVIPDEIATIEDLALSVLICSMTYSEGIASLEDPLLPKFMRKWHDKIAGVTWLTKLGFRRANQIDFASKANEFANYIERHSKAPLYEYKESDFQAMECPHAQIVKVTLMRDLGIPEKELMDRSWLMCLWDYVTLKAIAGHVKILNRDSLNAKRETADAIHDLVLKERHKCRV